MYYGIFAMAFVNLGCAVAQWVVLGRKLDGNITSSYYIVFIPFCVRAGVRIFEALLRGIQRYTICV